MNMMIVVAKDGDQRDFKDIIKKFQDRRDQLAGRIERLSK